VVQRQTLLGAVANFMSRFRFALAALALTFIAFAVYFPILPGTLIMDDLKLIQWDNPIVKGTTGPGSIWFRADFPLSTFVLWLQWKAWGTNPLGYHIVNIGLHVLSSLLIWRVLLQLRIRGAWLASFLFTVHPVCVASVARIAEIKNTLSLPFFLLSVWAYLRYEQEALYPEGSDKLKIFDSFKLRGAAVFYSLSLNSFILALLAKTSVVMLPVVLLCCAAWRRRRIGMKDLVHTTPHFALALGFGLMSAWFQKYQALGGEAVATQSLAMKIAMAAHICWFYLGKAFLPANLNIIYPAWKHGAGLWEIWMPAVLLMLTFLFGWSVRKAWGRHLLFALASFLVMLFPAMGFFDAQYLRNWQVSDHLQYAALIAPLAFAAAAILWLGEELREFAADLRSIARSDNDCPERETSRLAAGPILQRSTRSHEELRSEASAGQPALRGAFDEGGGVPRSGWSVSLRRRLRPAGAAAIGFAFVSVLSFISFERAELFTSEEKLLRDALVKNPGAWAAHNDLGCLYAQQNKYAEAVAHFQTSLAHNPDFPDAHVNLGRALLCLERPAEAEPHFAAVLRRYPAHPEAHRGVAKIMAMRNCKREAVLHLRTALRSKADAQTHIDLATLLYQGGDHREAIAQLRRATSLNATNVEALNNLAWLLATAPQPDARDGREAVICARKACGLTRFAQPGPVGTLAAAHAECGHFKQAVYLADKATHLAVNSGQGRFVDISRELLKLYRQEQPYHESAKSARPQVQ
jgi:tetratricopeptide (TPR) repeat protein